MPDFSSRTFGKIRQKYRMNPDIDLFHGSFRSHSSFRSQTAVKTGTVIGTNFGTNFRNNNFGDPYSITERSIALEVSRQVSLSVPNQLM